MISIRCPHCHVGLKVDETKLPSNITTFACPKCKEPIPVSMVNQYDQQQNHKEDEAETIILSSSAALPQQGKLHVISNRYTSEQTIILEEGINIIGRKSKSSDSPTTITTEDKQMSRAHILLEIKKDTKNQYKHYLSDNNSKNRTLYNNNYLEDGEVVVLKNKDEIQIGQTLLIFEA